MDTMRPRVSSPSRALPALLAAAVVSIVLGIIGMHALNTYAVAGNTDHAMTSPMTGPHADMSAEPGNAVPDGDNAPGIGSVVMLCFAMLATTAGVFLLLLHGLRRVPRAWAHLPAAPASVTGLVTARLGTGPPPVWEFSVIRC